MLKACMEAIRDRIKTYPLLAPCERGKKGLLKLGKYFFHSISLPSFKPYIYWSNPMHCCLKSVCFFFSPFSLCSPRSHLVLKVVKWLGLGFILNSVPSSEGVYGSISRNNLTTTDLRYDTHIWALCRDWWSWTSAPLCQASQPAADDPHQPRYATTFHEPRRWHKPAAAQCSSCGRSRTSLVVCSYSLPALASFSCFTSTLQETQTPE